MTNHDSDAADAVLDTVVGGLLATLAGDYRPAVDLTAAALAGARRAKRRARLAWSAGGGLATAAVAVAVVVAAGATGTGSAPTTAGTASGGSVTTHTQGALDSACVGKWLPWTDQSEAAMFGKGSAAQRAVVCTKDIETLKAVVPGLTMAPYFETFAEGENTDITADQIAQLGTGLTPSTHILKPWQYTATLKGDSAYFYISYATARSGVCTGCTTTTPQPLPGPRPGYRLVGETPQAAGPISTIGVLVETPDHAYLGIGVSPLNGRGFTPPFDLVKIVKDGRFISALDADLCTLYGG